MQQKEYFGLESVNYLESILQANNQKRIFLVTGKDSYASAGAEQAINPFLTNFQVTRHSDFSPNPKLEDIERGISLFKKGDYGLILAIGGGSVIDTAKLIGILAAQTGQPREYTKKEIKNKSKPLIAIPTTAGSGSEATHFAVLYVDGEKHSIAHEFILPDYSIVDPNLTLSLPSNITAITGMDALSQAIEAFWSVNSTYESENYSAEAINLAIQNLETAVNNPSIESRINMAKAANLAGKAINIAKTTAPHALSYILTSKHGIPHGHAVALTLGNILKYNSDITETDCNDERGPLYVTQKIKELLFILECSTPKEAEAKIKELMKNIGLETDMRKLGIKDEDIPKIASSVNIERLNNNPRRLTSKALEDALKI